MHPLLISSPSFESLLVLDDQMILLLIKLIREISRMRCHHKVYHKLYEKEARKYGDEHIR